MAAHYESKHGIVAIPQDQLYMGFTDLRNFTNYVPAEHRDSVTADFDTMKFSASGFTVAVRVAERVPYSLIRIQDDGAPFHFTVSIHFESVPEGTDFSIEVDADLNLMMKAMLGGKIKEGLDKVVDGLVAVSHGQNPGFPDKF
ncbi:MAG: hypothetical protein J5640_02770 [Bacteroidales bacterium]|nr:hypothetical protein [Bacteroidales bacterium]